MIGCRSIFLVLALAVFSVEGALAQINSPSLSTSVEPTSGTVGKPMVLTIRASAPDLKGLEILMPDAQETTWTLASKEPSVTDEAVAGGQQERVYRYTLFPFVTGRLTVPPVAVTYSSADGATSHTEMSDALWVEIVSVLKSSSDNQLRESYPPSSLPLPKPVVYTGFILLGVLLLVFAYWLWRRYSARLKKMLGVNLRPDEYALREIDRLEDERLIEQKKLKELYTRLTDTVRGYISQAYGVHAEDLTSTELLRYLDDLTSDISPNRVPAYKQALAKLSELLDEADLVKFARMLPEPPQCRRALLNGKEIVSLTRYRFLPEDAAGNGKRDEQEPVAQAGGVQ